MSEVLAAPTSHAAPHATDYWTHSKGWQSWAFTLDHKRIGVMYLAGITVMFLVGGLMALLLRAELFRPGVQMFDNNSYNQLFTLHGAIMTFLVIIPGIPAALGNVVLPLMLGAKDVAFPRMNLASFYLWCGGAIFFVTALVTGGLDTGWTFYTPYSITTKTSVVVATMGAFILGFSSIFTAINFIVTIHTLRPPGMTWFRLPLFLWAIYATAIIQVMATPVLAITLLLLAAERVLGLGIFDPALGGDPVLFQHFFWFYSHPAVYIMILPAMGVQSELIATFSRKHIFGYHAVAIASVGLAIFSALTFTVSIPSAVKVFNWMSTMYRGSISMETPMLYAQSFMFLFGIGGLTGLFLATLSTDRFYHDTYFVVAHFHYVMMGSTLIAMIGGVYYWWPKTFGRMYNERVGQIAAILVFLSFNLTFFPQFILGNKGMPRRYANYLPKFETLHQVSTIGAFTLGASLLLVTGNLVSSLYTGRKAPANPWGGGTLEWACASPPPHDNFSTPPVVGDPYASLELMEWIDDETGYGVKSRPAGEGPAHTHGGHVHSHS